MNAHQRRATRRAHPAPAEEMLPEGVWDDADGRLWAECCGCRRDREVEREHLDRFDVRYFFCGGSPHCIP